ncbi:MAG: protein-L-isoaspartate(D-aspartate) O-methyltransferase [Gammaproteobacteria bacterium]
MHAPAREAMLQCIASEALATAGYTGREGFSARLMAALARVPRHCFVPASQAAQAYINSALAIGHGQTISQPYIVALMTEVLELEPDAVVLEIGTGSGYQTAVLAELAGYVYSIELIPELATEAGERLIRLGYRNVEVRTGDGYGGWPEHAPYDAILVAAAVPQVPPALIEQLEPGGRLVLPLGTSKTGQMLTLIEKTAAGQAHRRPILPVAFVPFRREGRGMDAPRKAADLPQVGSRN